MHVSSSIAVEEGEQTAAHEADGGYPTPAFLPPYVPVIFEKCCVTYISAGCTVQTSCWSVERSEWLWRASSGGNGRRLRLVDTQINVPEQYNDASSTAVRSLISYINNENCLAHSQHLHLYAVLPHLLHLCLFAAAAHAHGPPSAARAWLAARPASDQHTVQSASPHRPDCSASPSRCSPRPAG